MATLKEMRQGNKRWIGSTNGCTVQLTTEEIYSADDWKLKWDPDDWKSTTVPGQSKTIKELMDRYEKGRPVPV